MPCVKARLIPQSSRVPPPYPIQDITQWQGGGSARPGVLPMRSLPGCSSSAMALPLRSSDYGPMPISPRLLQWHPAPCLPHLPLLARVMQWLPLDLRSLASGSSSRLKRGRKAKPYPERVQKLDTRWMECLISGHETRLKCNSKSQETISEEEAPIFFLLLREPRARLAIEFQEGME